VLIGQERKEETEHEKRQKRIAEEDRACKLTLEEQDRECQIKTKKKQLKLEEQKRQMKNKMEEVNLLPRMHCTGTNTESFWDRKTELLVNRYCYSSTLDNTENYLRQDKERI